MVRKIKSKGSKVAGNQGDILKQAQVMQQQMLVIQEELKAKELETSVGGGAVTVKINGQKEIMAINISDEILKEAVEDNDKEMLEDLIVSAVSEAMRQAEELAEKEMGAVTGGMNIPGLF
ncbi:MAG: YbaB/EbfC family nucleoid-associated protein [Psychrilyobacter sp.]|nr:YbaB/EbfC family nucleoid-associated protein [Psychrilyobacter sp.]